MFAEHTSYANAMAATGLTTFIIGAIVVALGPQRHSARFGD